MPRQHSWFALITAIHLCVTAVSALQAIRTPDEMVNEAYALPSDHEKLAALHRAIDVHPTHWYVHKQLGFRLLQTGDYEAAIQPLERALELGGDVVGDLQTYIAQAYAGLGRTDEALDWLRRSIDQGAFASGRQHWRGASEFEAIKSDERFIKLTGLVPAGDRPGRDEAWEFDVRFIHDRLEHCYYDLDRVTTSQALRKRFDDVIAQIPQRSDEQILLSIQEICADLFDGHTKILPPQSMLQRFLPFNVRSLDEGLFVTSATEDHAQWVGWQAVRIGGVSAEEAVRRIGTVISHDNESGRRAYSLYWLSFGTYLDYVGLAHDGSTTMLLRNPETGEEQSLDLNNVDHTVPDGRISITDRLPSDQLPLYLRNIPQPFWFDTIENGRIVYAQVNQISNGPNESLAGFFEKVVAEVDGTPEVEALVVDLRFNAGGRSNLNYGVMAALHRCRLLRQPGKLFVVSGGSTFSAGQKLLTDLQVELSALVVGVPSSSRPNFIGEFAAFTLPYHPEVRASVSDLYHQRGRDSTDRRVWIAPDLPAPPSLKALREGFDPALRVIMARLDDHNGESDLLAARADSAYGKQQWAEAAAAYAELRTLNSLDGRRNFQFAYALLTQEVDLPAAVDAFRTALDFDFEALSSAYYIGCASALLGRTDESIQWLQTAIDKGLSGSSGAFDNAAFDSIRDDPRFKALLDGE